MYLSLVVEQEFSVLCFLSAICVCPSIQVEVQTSLVALLTSPLLRPLPASQPPLVNLFFCLSVVILNCFYICSSASFGQEKGWYIAAFLVVVQFMFTLAFYESGGVSPYSDRMQHCIHLSALFGLSSAVRAQGCPPKNTAWRYIVATDQTLTQVKPPHSDTKK